MYVPGAVVGATEMVPVVESPAMGFDPNAAVIPPGPDSASAIGVARLVRVNFTAMGAMPPRAIVSALDDTPSVNAGACVTATDRSAVAVAGPACARTVSDVVPDARGRRGAKRHVRRREPFRGRRTTDDRRDSRPERRLCRRRRRPASSPVRVTVAVNVSSFPWAMATDVDGSATASVPPKTSVPSSKPVEFGAPSDRDRCGKKEKSGERCHERERVVPRRAAGQERP